jgi:hypothetical protein
MIIKISTTLYCKLLKSYYICINELLQLSFLGNRNDDERDH